jgi:hypothetical protein
MLRTFILHTTHICSFQFKEILNYKNNQRSASNAGHDRYCGDSVSSDWSLTCPDAKPYYISVMTFLSSTLTDIHVKDCGDFHSNTPEMTSHTSETNPSRYDICRALHGGHIKRNTSVLSYTRTRTKCYVTPLIL